MFIAILIYLTCAFSEEKAAKQAVMPVLIAPKLVMPKINPNSNYERPSTVPDKKNGIAIKRASGDTSTTTSSTGVNQYSAQSAPTPTPTAAPATTAPSTPSVPRKIHVSP